MKNTEATVKERKVGRYSVRERKKFPFIYCLIALPVIQIMIFFFYSNFSAIMLAFQNKQGEWSFESIISVFDAFVQRKDSMGFDPIDLIGRSLTIWIIQHLLGFVVSMLTSYILTKHMIGSKFFRVVYYVPAIVGAVVLSTVMKEMYAYDGIILKIMKSFDVSIEPMVLRNGLLSHKDTAFSTLMIQTFIISIAGGSMIMAGAYMRIPEEIFESAKLEGCGFFRETFQIAVPCAWPTLSTMFIFSLCSIFTADIGMYLYSDGTGKFGMTSVGYYLYRYNVAISNPSSGSNAHLYGYISAFGLVITFITIPIVLLGRKLLEKIQDNVEF